jgi:cell division protein FtsN
MTPLETPATTPVPQVAVQPAAVAGRKEAPLAVTATAAAPAVTLLPAEPAVVAPAKAAEPAPAPAVTAKPAAAASVLAKAPVAAKPTAASSTTIKSRTGRYYVIAGAYSSLKHAEKGRKVLARTGRSAQIILPYPGSRLFRLTAADYPDLASAQREAQRLRVTTHCDYNTLKF